MTNVEVYTYNVGQGLFNILIDKGKSGLCGGPFCAIFDCGKVQHCGKYDWAAIKKEAINLLVKVKGPDLIVISHQDTDHWDHLKDLLEEYKREVNVSNIDLTAIIGNYGAGKKYRKFIHNMQETYTKVYPYHSRFFISPDTTGYPIGIQNPRVGSTSGVAKNTRGIIYCYVDEVAEGKPYFLFPGDATIHTFSALNGIEEKLAEHINGRELLLMLAPHHGSGNDIFTYKCIKKRVLDRDENQPYLKFLNKHKPQKMIISAGECSGYKHPSLDFVEKTEKYVKGGQEKHSVSVYGGAEHHDTESNIYNTLDFPKAPYLISGARDGIGLSEPEAPAAEDDNDSPETEAPGAGMPRMPINSIPPDKCIVSREGMCV
ncbi:MAG: hypothetical protein J1F22_04720 [Lachnospiraceae bacterium]|nr:hypothetical protein [Lachnospiraceae bacterium]